MKPRTVLAIDPGTRKCGIAVVAAGSPPAILYRIVVEPGAVPGAIGRLLGEYPVDALLIGDATAARATANCLKSVLPESLPVHFIPEAFSSVKARQRWCRENPPRALWERLFPGFRTPTEACDDYAAVILAEQFLSST
jgi:RNase H-fold protein (predicted Holliday junction resolvase)